MADYRLYLYINGRTARSEAVVDELQQVLEQRCHDQYELQVVDVHTHPELAERHKVLATPTIIRELPLPVRRVIGDLSARDEVLVGLDVHPTEKKF